MFAYLFEFSIILVLSLVNGLFAMSELAVMSSNRGRLGAHASNGEKGARAALYLAKNSALFLATVQIGITLIGIIAGVFGGATLAEDLEHSLSSFGLTDRLAEPVAFISVVGGITYLSLVLGELVPKQIALSHPEKVAILVSRPLVLLSQICSPLVWVLERSSELTIKLLPFEVGQRNEVSVEDIQHLISQGEKEGEIRPAEQDMAFRLFKLDDRPIRAFMTVRRDIVWLDLRNPLSDMWELALGVPHSYFPVAEGSLDQVLGVISVKDLWIVMTSNGSKSVKELTRPALTVLESKDALAVIEKFKKERRQVAFVVDEHGGFSGMVTTHDLLEAIVGDLADYDGEQPAIVPRDDGSVFVDAALDIEELLIHFKLEQGSRPKKHEYHSVGGLLFTKLKKVPSVGEKLLWSGLQFEVADMDRNRIDKVIVTKTEVSD